ncbi:MAG: TIGR03905 family TSCPD domain-containing protein [Ruminococcus sp.]
MKYSYTPKGVCSRLITIEVEDGKILNVEFTGGCNGNLKGIGALVKGMDVNEAISRLENIRCGMKNTSCPDQLAKALKEAL